MLDQLADKKIVVLGGTSGIGLAVAQHAAQAGAAVVVVSRQPARVAEALARLPAGSEGHAVDLADAAAMRALFDQLGAFDHLAYTAGEQLALGALATRDLAAARGYFETRYWGALTAVQQAAPRLRPGGSIVLTSGIASRRPRAGWALGASICGAMEALTRALAVELAPIRVNVISPGIVETPLWASIPDEARAAMYQGTAAALPVGRVGQPDDLAAIYLAAMRNGFLTGQAIVVDGGGTLV